MWEMTNWRWKPELLNYNGKAGKLKETDEFSEAKYMGATEKRAAS